MSLSLSIARNASRHSQLLSWITEVEDAPAYLAEQESTISNLQSKMTASQERMKSLGDRIAEQRIKPTRAPTLKLKLTQSLMGKKRKSAGKSPEAGEQEDFGPLVAAMQDEEKEKEYLIELERDMNKARILQSELSVKAAKHKSLNDDLHALYDDIFGGPSPGYPQEDQLEYQVKAAKTVHDGLEHSLQAELKALEYLTRAEKTVRECRDKLRDAIYWTTASFLGGGRPDAGMEGTCLREARSLARTAETLVQHAQKHSSSVKPLGTLTIAREVPVRNQEDKVFDAKVKALATEAKEVQFKLRINCEHCAARISISQKTVAQSAMTVQSCQNELDLCRRKIFQEITAEMENEGGRDGARGEENGSSEVSDAPPSYDYSTAMGEMKIHEETWRYSPPLHVQGYMAPLRVAERYYNYDQQPRASSPQSGARRYRPLPRPPG